MFLIVKFGKLLLSNGEIIRYVCQFFINACLGINYFFHLVIGCALMLEDFVIDFLVEFAIVMEYIFDVAHLSYNESILFQDILNSQPSSSESLIQRNHVPLESLCQFIKFQYIIPQRQHQFYFIQELDRFDYKLGASKRALLLNLTNPNEKKIQNNTNNTITYKLQANSPIPTLQGSLQLQIPLHHLLLQLHYLLLHLYLQLFLYCIHRCLQFCYFLLHFVSPSHLLVPPIMVLIPNQGHHPILNGLNSSHHLLFLPLFLLSFSHSLIVRSIDWAASPHDGSAIPTTSIILRFSMEIRNNIVFPVARGVGGPGIGVSLNSRVIIAWSILRHYIQIYISLILYVLGDQKNEMIGRFQTLLTNLNFIFTFEEPSQKKINAIMIRITGYCRKDQLSSFCYDFNDSFPYYCLNNPTSNFMKKSALFTLLILFIFISCISCQGRDLYFNRVIKCLDFGEKQCMKWNNTIQLSYYRSFWGYGCFSEDQYVLTEDGPTSFKNIKIGDRILALNIESGIPEYSEIISWLHRDTDTSLEYEQIKCGNLSFSASPSHNIAYDNDSEISFKLADEIEKGNTLISLSDQIIRVDSKGKQFQKGMFSPYTNLGNFYIFPKNSRNQNDMILVHCFSQVLTPAKVDQHWFHAFMTSPILHFIGFNSHQNQEHDNYQHIGVHLLKAIDGFHGRAVYTSNSNNNEEQQKRQALSVLFSSTSMMEQVLYGK